MSKDEKDFVDKYRAVHGGTEVEAMLQYRKMNLTSTPYNRKSPDDIIGAQHRTGTPLDQ